MSFYYCCIEPHGDTQAVIAGPGRPIAYTRDDDCAWIACPEGKGPFPRAVLFEDGAIFDTILYAKQIAGGWRRLEGYKPHIRIPMGRAVI